jgi:hypothetical protein
MSRTQHADDASNWAEFAMDMEFGVAGVRSITTQGLCQQRPPAAPWYLQQSFCAVDLRPHQAYAFRLNSKSILNGFSMEPQLNHPESSTLGIGIMQSCRPRLTNQCSYKLYLL